MTRESLDELAAFLAERIGEPAEDGTDPQRVEPLRRQLRHAVVGIEAYLAAVDAGSSAVVHLRRQADDLWDTLEQIAARWPRTTVLPAVPAIPGPAA
ncbi:hypothetical protein [Kitasatospora sp. CMC57]